MKGLGWAFLLGWVLGGRAMRAVIERRLARETEEALHMATEMLRSTGSSYPYGFEP